MLIFIIFFFYIIAICTCLDDDHFNLQIIRIKIRDGMAGGHEKIERRYIERSRIGKNLHQIQ